MTLNRRWLLCAGASFAAQSTFSQPAFAQSASGVAALNAAMHALVDQQKLAGVVTLLARKGKVVSFDAYGKKDAGAADPMTKDAIFRIASMTKPICGVAMMQLYEKGLWKLDDPVSKHIPQFAGLKVKAADGSLVDQATPMTMAQLMSHTAGFGVSALYANDGLSDGDLKDMIAKLAKLPLASQPGTDWAYGPVVNIQGYVVEKLSGLDLADYMQKHIFDPLKMPDTQFWVAPAKASRVVRIHTYDSGGKIVPTASPLRTDKPRLLSGSGGLYSTAADYFRFCQALLNGGQLDGARILKPETVKLMRVDVLKPGVGIDLYGPVQKGLGFGMDFAIHRRPAESGLPQGQDSYWWGGAFGTWFWIDPVNELIFIGMIQNLQGSTPGAGTPEMRATSAKLVYATL